MKKLVLLLSAMVLLGAGIMVGSLLPKQEQKNESFIPVAKVTGDVKTELLLEEVYPQLEQLRFQVDNVEFTGVSLADLVNLAQPYAANSRLLLIGDDGFTSELSLPLPDGCYLSMTPKYGWEVKTLHHPQSANSKRIQEIVVVSKEPSQENGVSIITKEQNICSITPGQLRTSELEMNLIKEGQAVSTYQDQQLSVVVYTTDRSLPVSVLANEYGYAPSSVMAIGENGKTLFDEGTGTLVYKGNSMSYRKKDGREQIHNLSGLILDPPRKMVTQVYHDALEHVLKDEPTMVIYLDGLGYHSYKEAAKLGAFPFLSKNSLLASVVTAYTPVTNAGMAQMITGVTADLSGISTRDNREPKVATIFDEVTNAGKTAILVEGNIGILKTSVPPILNLDANNNGTDDEVFESAIKQLENKPDYMMVHFHGIDDYGHANGPLSELTLNKMKETDEYVRLLTEAFQGRVYVVSDHGMHVTPEGGSHGKFFYEDMIVPYFTVTAKTIE